MYEEKLFKKKIFPRQIVATSIKLKPLKIPSFLTSLFCCLHWIQGSSAHLSDLTNHNDSDLKLTLLVPHISDLRDLIAISDIMGL